MSDPQSGYCSCCQRPHCLAEEATGVIILSTQLGPLGLFVNMCGIALQTLCTAAAGAILPPTPPNAPYHPVPGSSETGSSSSSATYAGLLSGSPQLPFAFTPSPHSLPTLADRQVCCFVLLDTISDCCFCHRFLQACSVQPSSCSSCDVGQEVDTKATAFEIPFPRKANHSALSYLPTL